MTTLGHDLAAAVPDIDELVGDDRLHGRIYTDEAIFAMEMRRIFGRTWVYVGHESEVRNPGDYKVASIGYEPVVLTRDDAGEVHLLINRCRHRASLVCRQEKGHGNYLRCPYHGWTYKNSGELIGVPRPQRYPPDFDKSRLGLGRVPRVETYRGLVFGSFDPEIPALTDHLAQARPYLDTILDLSVDAEIELTAGASRHRYPGNWKLQIENGVDGYHAMILHESFFEIQRQSPERAHARLATREETKGWTEAFDHGHALLTREASVEAVERFRAAYPDYAGRLESKHGAERLRELLGQFNLFIFPNLFLILNQIRVVTPLGPQSTAVSMYPTMLKGAPDALNAERLREHEEGFAAGGFVAPDDQEVFALVQEALKAESVPWLVLERGIHDEVTLDNGAVRGQPSDETPQRGIYRAYRRLMTAGDGDPAR